MPTIVAFFGGTGFNFNEKNPNYYQAATNAKPNYDQINDDTSLSDLYNILPADSEKQTKKGFHGCHTRGTVGGGTFAFGIEEPANELHAKLIEDSKKLNPNEKIKVVLTAHSRGCLTAMLLAKKVGKNPALQDKVEIVLNLRDPVPGNLKELAAISGGAMAAGRLSDLSLCKCIKSAHITVQETGMLITNDIGLPGFNVLIPKFSSMTSLEIDPIPGGHSVQETYDFKNPHSYQLGIYKTLQLYLENDVKIDYVATFKRLWELHKTATLYDSSSGNAEQNEAQAARVKQLEQNFNSLNEDQKREQLLKFAKETQAALYEAILKHHKTVKTIAIVERDLHTHHGGGRYKATATHDKATHLNQRHAELTTPAKAIPYIGYSGPRKDLQATSGLPGKLTIGEKSKTSPELRSLCIQRVIKIINDQHFWDTNLPWHCKTPDGVKNLRKLLKEHPVVTKNEREKLWILKNCCQTQLLQDKTRQKITVRFYEFIMQLVDDKNWTGLTDELAKKSAEEMTRVLNAFEESYGVRNPLQHAPPLPPHPAVNMNLFQSPAANAPVAPDVQEAQPSQAPQPSVSAPSRKFS